MDRIVAEKFFKKTKNLPPNENIQNEFQCALDAPVNCKGKLYCGKQAVYFYSKINYKTVLGKSTKLRLKYRDIRSIQKNENDRILINMEVSRQIGQDLRSTGSQNYIVPNQFTLTQFRAEERDECFDQMRQNMTEMSNQIMQHNMPISSTSELEGEKVTSGPSLKPPTSRTAPQQQHSMSKLLTEDAETTLIDGVTNRKAYHHIERNREAEAFKEFDIKNTASDFMWHPFRETVKGLTLKIVAQQLCTHGSSSIYQRLHQEKSNDMHLFTPERAEPLPEYLQDSLAPMPTAKEILTIPYKHKWEMSYRHTPTIKQFFAPKHLYFTDKKQFYFISPFKIIVIEKIFGSGFPLCSNFNYMMMWEYEQISLKEQPLSVNDIAVSIKQHYTLQITKPILFGTSIVANETEHQVMTITKNHTVDKLRKELLIQMEREIRRVERPRMISEMGDVTIQEDPVSDMMDRLNDQETQFQANSRRLNESLTYLKSDLQCTIKLMYLIAVIAAICYFAF